VCGVLVVNGLGRRLMLPNNKFDSSQCKSVCRGGKCEKGTARVGKVKEIDYKKYEIIRL